MSVAGTKILALLFSFAATVLTVRIISASYGASGFGAYSLIAALIMILPVADLGLSLALTNLVARGSHTRSWTAFRLAISPTVSILALVGAFVAVASGVLSAAGLWPSLLGAPSLLLGDPNAFMPVYGALCAVWIVTSPSYRVLTGLGRANTVIALQAAGPTIAVIATAIAAANGAPLLLHAFFPLLAAILATAAGWVIALPQLGAVLRRAPQPFRLHRRHYASALVAGMSGLLFSVGGLLMYAFDRILLAQLSGSLALATFAASIALLSAAQSALGSFGTFLWPYYTRLKLDGKLSGRLILSHTAIFIAIGLFGAAAVWFGYPLYVNVAGVKSPGDSLFLTSMCVLVITQAFLLVPTSALTTPRLLRVQGSALFAALVLKILLSLVLVPHLAESGVLIATVCGIWLVQVPVVVYMIRREVTRDHIRGATS